MMDAGRHPRIELLVDSEVEDITGFVGNFRARIRRRPRYVDGAECTSCGDCEEVCPVVVSDEYQEGLSSRRAIYLPFPQAVPSAYTLDADSCLGFNPIACGKCLEVCDKKCIDFDAREEVLDVEVGTVVVATGMDLYDPKQNDEYGYTRFPNVITSMEFERLINAGGPTAGELVRPSDQQVPGRIGFIQCVGSRSLRRGVPYCSNFCCMNTIKETLLLADHYPESRSTVYYMDIRAFGKGFEDLYRRSREAGVRYLRGLPGRVREDPETHDLVVDVENTLTGRQEEHRLDMLVLAVGLVPRVFRSNGNGKRDVDEILSLSHTSDGFVMEAHPKLKPVDVPTRGVFVAGCVEAPKDIKDSVTQAGAAAVRAGNILGAGKVSIEAITAQLDPDLCSLCKICANVCPFHAIVEADKKSGRLPDFIEAACAGCGTCAAECPFDAIAMRHFEDTQILAQIDGILADNPMSKIVAFACNWCSYAGGDTAGTSRLQYPASVRLIRTMCSGRVDQRFIWHAFRNGAPLVLVSGCHFTDCHYIDAVTWTQRRVEKVWNRMEKLGIRPERLQLEWISAAEGQKFARVMRELESLLCEVSAEEVAETRRVLAEDEELVPKLAPPAGTSEGLPVVTDA
jgi:heterodisulfide reductase subunit A